MQRVWWGKAGLEEWKQPELGVPPTCSKPDMLTESVGMQFSQSAAPPVE